MRLFLLLASSVSLLALAACDDGHKSNVNVTGNGVVDCRASPDDCVKPDRGDNL